MYIARYCRYICIMGYVCPMQCVCLCVYHHRMSSSQDTCCWGTRSSWASLIHPFGSIDTQATSSVSLTPKYTHHHRASKFIHHKVTSLEVWLLVG